MPRLLALPLLALAVCSSPAAAVVLANGQTNLSGTTLAQRPELAQQQISSTLSRAFSFQGPSGTVSGTLFSDVGRSTVDNALIFNFRVVSDARSANTIQQLRLGGFGPNALDADYRLDGLGSATVTPAFNFGNGAVNFYFDGGDGISPGESSYFLFLRIASATGFDTSGQADLVSVLGDAFTFSSALSVYAPTFASDPGGVPEPASWAMVLAGVGLAGAAMRRRPARVRVTFA